MSVARERVPQKGAAGVRAALYFRISSEHHSHCARNQKAANRRYADARTLHVASISSDRANAKSESHSQS